MTIYRASNGKQHDNGSTWDPTKKSPNSATYARNAALEAAKPRKKKAVKPEPEAPRDVMGEQHWASGRE